MIILYTLLGLLLIAIALLWNQLRLAKEQIIALDKEQHEQNEELIKLMKISHEHDIALLMIISHLKQEQPMPYFGTVGEA